MIIFTQGTHFAIARYCQKPSFFYKGNSETIHQVLQQFGPVHNNLHQALKNNDPFVLPDNSTFYQEIGIAKTYNKFVLSSEHLCFYEKLRHNFILELERKKIPYPPTIIIDNPEQLIKTLQSPPFERFVLKGLNLGTRILNSKNSKAFSKLHEEKILKEFQENPNTTALIQQFIPGPEISCEIYLHKGNPIIHNFTIEEKYEEEWEMGKLVGCANNLILPPLPTPKLNSIAQTTLSFAPDNFTGFFDINYIYHKGNMYALEITPRVGYLGTITFAHMLREAGLSFDDLAQAVRDGIPLYNLNIPYGFGTTLKLAENLNGLTFPKELTNLFIPEGTIENTVADKELGSVHQAANNPLEAIEKTYKIVETLKDFFPSLYTKIPDKHLIERINAFLE